MVGDASGPLATTVGAGLAGFQSAIGEINAAGGVNGRKIKVSGPIDSLSTAAGAQAALQKALSKRPTVLFVNTPGSSFAAMQPALTAAAIPTLSTAIIDDLAAEPAGWYYAATYDSPSAAKMWTAGMKAQLDGSLDGKRIAFIAFEQPATVAYLKYIKEAVEEEGGSIVATEFTPTSLTSFTSQANKVVATHPDGIISVDLPGSTILEVTALQTAGFSGTILGGPVSNDSVTLKKATRLGANYLAPRALNLPAAGGSLTAAATKHGFGSQATGDQFSRGWVLAYALAGGLQDCPPKTCDSETLEKALDSAGPVDPGPAGKGIAFAPLEFTARKHIIISAAQYFKWDTATNAEVSVGDPVSMTATE